jgi:hypothetical protein
MFQHSVITDLHKEHHEVSRYNSSDPVKYFTSAFTFTRGLHATVTIETG